jgi:hypothetical protein
MRGRSGRGRPGTNRREGDLQIGLEPLSQSLGVPEDTAGDGGFDPGQIGDAELTVKSDDCLGTDTGQCQEVEK